MFISDREEYKNIRLYTMEDNKSQLPVYIRHYSDRDNPTELHRHEMIQINYVKKGQLFHQINSSTFPIVKGDVFIIPPYIPHRLIKDGENAFEIIELEFEPEFLFGDSHDNNMSLEDYKSLFNFAYIEPFLVSEGEVRPRLNLTGKSQVNAETLLSEIEDEYNQREDSFILSIKALLLLLLVLLGRKFNQSIEEVEQQVFARHQDALDESLKYIAEHYTEALTIEQVARVALLSPSYYSYLFKTMTGKTFIEHLTLIRLHKAMELLKNTDNFVLEICLDAGFKNVNHFNRTFKAFTGLTPLQYRKSFHSNPRE